ncbi:MAG TPA: MFS transporter [Alphaproteobacteria bacterium]|nr:MFS transporter [Alphaproteobacteria bacterium]
MPTELSPRPTSVTLDVGEAIDRSPWSGLQKRVVVLAALAVVLDGIDGQLIGYAIPVLMKDWGLAREAFTFVVAAGLIAMSVGSAVAGYAADRVGRRRVIIGSVILFAVATAAIGLAQGPTAVALLRFCAGLGIGGALPSATTLVAEYTPARRRTTAVTATIVCLPAGGMLAGLFAAYVLPSLGWRALFLIGGTLPLAVALLLSFALPESVRFLARRPRRWPELALLFRRMAVPAPDDAAFTDYGEQYRERDRAVSMLFGEARTRDTLTLWAAFFLCLFAVYSAFSWLPTALSAQGLSLATAGSGLTAYNLGGVVGALLCAQAIARFGSRWSLVLCCAGGAVSAFALTNAGSMDPRLLVLGLGVHGLFVNAVQSTLYAVCAHVYPTAVRATGTASALAVGRLGALAAALVGAAVITARGLPAYLAMLGIAMTGVLVALALLRDHIPQHRTMAEPALA